MDWGNRLLRTGNLLPITNLGAIPLERICSNFRPPGCDRHRISCSIGYTGNNLWNLLKMNEVYNNPKYYEIAFSYRDIAAEVDVFEQVIEAYGFIPVSMVFEIGCGPRLIWRNSPVEGIITSA